MAIPPHQIFVGQTRIGEGSNGWRSSLFEEWTRQLAASDIYWGNVLGNFLRKLLIAMHYSADTKSKVKNTYLSHFLVTQGIWESLVLVV